MDETLEQVIRRVMEYEMALINKRHHADYITDAIVKELDSEESIVTREYEA